MSKPKSEETKRKLSEAAKKRTKYPMEGKHHSEETKKKQSDIMKGKYKGENNPMYGKPGANRGKHWRLENGKRIYYTI